MIKMQVFKAPIHIDIYFKFNKNSLKNWKHLGGPYQIASKASITTVLQNHPGDHLEQGLGMRSWCSP